ncbi:transglutaminase family protein [Azospirillum melinis]|uniref:Transglutaminase family protein n=1 Tax=Azospirillum melinis TaxID=328839 RepID=A0ABX2KJ75_9PROT|nr:transglutaminase family protein [Azospirillum melinis]MBP2304239.1 transglutaminase-like putative cysteine protease [Azospirillum melinis]NUB01481.1 transglutaminase family protein [Azospirillum melinis]
MTPPPSAPASGSSGLSTRYRLRHSTAYDYGEDVPISHHLLHLTARPHPRQRIRRSLLTIDPAPAVRTERVDYFGNTVTYVAVQEPHRTFSVIAESEVEVFDPPVLAPDDSPAWEHVRDSLRGLTGPDDGAEITQYCFDSALVAASPELLDYVRGSFTPGRPAVAAAINLMNRINHEFAFDPTATTVATPLAAVMRNRRGVCQDFAHIAVGCVRAIGLPARYVSGYLRTLPPPGQPRLVGADVSHAWASVWCGATAGWLDICPTNACIANRDFITIAWGRDYDDVSPARGVLLGGAGHGLTVSVDVEPLED